MTDDSLIRRETVENATTMEFWRGTAIDPCYRSVDLTLQNIPPILCGAAAQND